MSDDVYFELDLEQNVRIPQPLDPHIASVSIRTGSNNPTDYFDLLLSASFGSEYIVLNTGEEKLEVKVTIRKAEVRIDSANCELLLLTDASGENWSGHQRQHANKSNNRDASLQGGADFSVDTSGPKAGAGLKASAQVQSGQNTEDSLQVERNILPWRLVSENTVQIGFLDDFTRPLSGKIVDECVSIRVTPTDTSKKVGVLARTRVRERWIDIEDVSSIGFGGRISNFLDGLAGGDSKSTRRRELFAKLLAHLVVSELQDQDEVRDATLAASAIVFSPRTERLEGYGIPSARTELKVDPTTIDNFISANGNELQVLREAGVELEDETDGVADSFQEIWRMNGSLVYLPKIDFRELEEWYSLSFGRKVVVQVEGDESPFFEQVSILLTSEVHERAEAAQILELMEKNGLLPYHGIELSVLAKGQQAFRAAELFGFEYGYQTFQKRIQKHAAKTTYGNLFSFHRVIEAGDGEGELGSLSGAELHLQIYGRGEGGESGAAVLFPDLEAIKDS